MYNKTHWEKVLRITPEIFTNTDNYRISERNLLGHFKSSRVFGLSPNGGFRMMKDIDTDRVYIKNLECLAITANGRLINITPNMSFGKELSLSKAADKKLYVVLTVNPYAAAASEYGLELKKTDETIENGIPILKIYPNNDYWEIDVNYIPPSVALSSSDMLKWRYVQIKETLDDIVKKLPEENIFYEQVTQFKLELDNYSLHESPQELILLLKKTCWSLMLYLKSIRKINELPDINSFIEEPYNQNETGEALHLGIQHLINIDRQIDAPEEDSDKLMI